MRWWPALAAALALGACGGEERAQDEWAVVLPQGAPALPVPPGSPLTEASVALGKALFFEPRLSLGGEVSCASCHRPDRAFADTVPFSVGAHGRTTARNTPSLVGVAYVPLLMWDGGVPSLEQQVLVPAGVEGEMAADIGRAAEALRSVEPYRSLSRKAYGRELDLFAVTHALASYERTLIGGRSRSDRFLYGRDSLALSGAERAGWLLFSSERLGCTHCHSGFGLSDQHFYNIGLADAGADPGRQRITLKPSDRGAFKVPTLRNITRTAPYMHDGSLPTLDAVIDHFASGGGPDTLKSPLMHPFALTPRERQDLLAFLGALADERNFDR